MSASKKIIINTLATYGRAVFAAALALFSSRWVISSLGQSDYGLYSVVGSMIVFVVFFNNVLAGSAARFFAFSIGSGNSDETNRWFNTALSIHFVMAFILVISGYFAGNYVVGNILSVPRDRVESCLTVFNLSLISAFVSMIAVPYTAMFAAKQKISEIAFWGVLQSILSFSLAYQLLSVTGDRLVLYSLGMVSIVVLIQCIQIARATLIMNECRINRQYLFEHSRLKKLFGFSSWALIGSVSVMLRDQGSAVLLNLFFGPRVNAAYGVATQVSSQTNQLSAAMIGAFSPEITASEGRGDRGQMLRLANQASKFGALLMLFFAVPLIIDMDYILNIWLKNPPEHAASFCRLILCSFMVDRLGIGSILAISASGKIAIYQVVVGGIMLLTLPIAWVLFKFGYPAPTVSVIALLTICIATIFRVTWSRHQLGMSIKAWLLGVVRPCIFVTFVSGSVGFVAYLSLAPSVARLLLIVTCSCIATLFSIWYIALDVNDKAYLQKIIDKRRRVR